MCDKITKIASQNKFQWIGICEHGAGHIYWRSAHVCISAQELELLTNQALAGQLPVERAGKDYVLWLKRFALRLTEKEYVQIVDLFACASDSVLSQPMLSGTSSDLGKVVLH